MREYEYNAEKQLIGIKREGGREQRNRYDGEGLRAEKEERGKRRRYVYYGGEVIEEEGEGEKERRYRVGYGTEVLEEGGKSYYYHKDEQRSTKYISNEEKKTENQYEYDSYGRSRRKVEGIENKIRYTGQEYEDELEGYYVRARNYREEYGRFLEEDEYEGDGLNLYVYCKNNPVIYYDPDIVKQRESIKHQKGYIILEIKQSLEEYNHDQNKILVLMSLVIMLGLKEDHCLKEHPI